jgi:DNA repair exonuclease SbcCD ATPase subunit
MKKRFVILSDLHAHPWSAFAKGDGLNNSRLQRTLDVLEQSLMAAHNEDIPWLFAGDLVHTAGYSLNVVLTSVASKLHEFPDVEKVAVWGNHDARGVGGRIELDQTVFPTVLAAVPNLTVALPELGTRELSNGMSVSGAGYQPRANLLVFPDLSEVGLYHQTVRGSLAPNDFVLEEGIDPEELLKRHRLSIVGHIHHPQQIEAPDGQGILIPGSPEHHNFGDRGEHGWWIVTLPDAGETGNPELEFMPGGSPEFRTVETPEGVKADGHFYRVRSMVPGATLPEGAVAVAPSPTVVKHRDTLRGVSDVEPVLQAWLKTQPPEAGKESAYLEAGRQLLTAQEPTRLRDMRVTYLRLKNFCCFAEQELRPQEGLWLITGTGRDYPSNGAGKSSLVGEALYWLLFGRTTKGLGAEEVIRWGQTECEVEAVLRGGGEDLLVTRRRGPAGHTLTVRPRVRFEGDDTSWQSTSVTEMTEKLNRYLGLTPEIFQNLAYFSQEKLLLFSSATDGERKNVLADLMGLDAYQQAYVAAGAVVSVQEEERIRVSTRMEMTTALIKQREEEARDCYDTEVAEVRLGYIHRGAKELIARRRQKPEAQRSQWEEEVRQEATHTQEERLAIARNDVTAAKEEAARGFSSLDLAREAVERLPRAQEELQILQKRESKVAGALQEARTAQTKLDTTMGQVLQRRRDLERQQAEADKALSQGMCPTCGQRITAEHREQCLAPFEAQLHELVDELATIERDSLVNREALRWHDQEIEEISERQAIATQLVRRLQTTEKALASLKASESILAAQEELAVPAEFVTQRVSDRIAVEMERYTQRQHARVERARQYVQRKASELEQITNQLAAHRTELDEHAKEEEALRGTIAIHEYWKTGFSKQGLQSLLVEEVALLFNENRSNIFPLLTQGVYDVQFSTLSKTRAGELREKTEFLVYEHGRRVPYGVLSGGQRRRIDIGIMLVLTQAVAEWMGTRGVLGTLILDEVFGFLDASGAEGLLAALGQINERVPTIYVVTHDTNLQSMLPNVIHVEQNAEGVSEVV